MQKVKLVAIESILKMLDCGRTKFYTDHKKHLTEHCRQDGKALYKLSDVENYKSKLTDKNYEVVEL